MRERASSILILVMILALSITGTACSDTTSSTVAPGGLEGGSAPSTPQTTVSPSDYVTVDVNEAFQQLNSMGQGAQIVDVREPGEWAATGVPIGAVLIPLAELEQRAPAELAKDGPVYVICNSGNRSRVGAETLIGLGYTEVYNVAGGIQAWLAAGLPVESYQP